MADATSRCSSLLLVYIKLGPALSVAHGLDLRQRTDLQLDLHCSENAAPGALLLLAPIGRPIGPRPLAVTALRGCLGSAVCHRATAVPVHRSTSFAPASPLPARPQRGRGRPFHTVDRVVEWVHRAPGLLHDLRRGGPLHRVYRVGGPADTARHKQPGQKSHPPALLTDAKRCSTQLRRRLNPPGGSRNSAGGGPLTVLKPRTHLPRRARLRLARVASGRSVEP